MSSILTNEIDQNTEQRYFLEIVNGTSSTTVPNDSFDSDFYSTFANSSLLTNLEKLTRQVNLFDELDISSVTLECSGVMKFMPYDGFYPAQRTLDLVKFFDESYGSTIRNSQSPSAISVGGITSPPRPVYQALFAPGILYNTIKSESNELFGTVVDDVPLTISRKYLCSVF